MFRNLKPWKFRAVQVDLARQMETLDFIFRFIDFVAEYRYNVLVLYLEGRLKTRSFPYPPKEESYTPGQMKNIIEYAGSKGIEVLPVVSNLGHAELFLRYPELSHLAELRGGSHGRFSDLMQQFCPSLKETYTFFSKYYSEISEIFSSEYIHIGNDESWDIGFCELCRKKAEGKEGQSGIFAKHIISTHEIITKKLDRKMMMWDDMFEVYPEVLEVIPRDITMCCWQYDNLVDVPKAHFINRQKMDIFATYEKMGFSYIFAANERMARNIETFTKYAVKYKALGGMVTTWEKTSLFLHENYPNIAFAGELWATGNLERADEIFNGCTKKIFGINEPLFINSVKTLKNMSVLPEIITPESFLRGPITPLEFERYELFSILRQVIKGYKDKVEKSTGNEVLEDILIHLKRYDLQHRLRTIIPEMYNRLNNNMDGEANILVGEIQKCLNDIDEIIKLRKSQWRKYRSGVVPCNVEVFYQKFKENISRILNLATGKTKEENTGLLTIHYFLPDMYSAQQVEILIKYNGEEWQKISSGVFKPIRDEGAFYYFSYPISNKKVPKEIRIETWGYGGQGLVFLEIINPQGRYIPAAIKNIEGLVLNSQNILTDDLKWCFMGEKNTCWVFNNPDMAKARHCIEIIFKKI